MAAAAGMVLVKTVDGNSFQITLEDGATVLALKQAVSSEKSIPVTLQDLIFKEMVPPIVATADSTPGELRQLFRIDGVGRRKAFIFNKY